MNETLYHLFWAIDYKGGELGYSTNLTHSQVICNLLETGWDCICDDYDIEKLSMQDILKLIKKWLEGQENLYAGMNGASTPKVFTSKGSKLVEISFKITDEDIINFIENDRK